MNVHCNVSAAAQQIEDGGTLVVKPGYSFLLECCRCGLTHEWHVDVDGEGNVRLRLDVVEEEASETDPDP